MSSYYKKLLFKIYMFLSLFFVIILYVIYTTFKSYALEENKMKMQDLLMHNKALHTYVEKTLKPIIYTFQDEHKIASSYFDPKILSFTYISRHIMQEYNKEREHNGLKPLIYKIASNNPRNIVNHANLEEKELLHNFQNGRLKRYTKEMILDGDHYIYYAMPIAKNKASCMRCHSTPDIAPSGLIKMYGDKKGFGEKVGEIRAFISVAMPLDLELQKMRKLYMIICLALSSIFILSLVIIFIFIKKLDKKDQKLQNQIKFDGLTKIFNRYKFNKDIVKMIDNNENIYLMMFDIDFFKKINDTYGHPVGDVVLKELAEIISHNIDEKDRFYRVGGEEFAIISFDKTENEQHKYALKIIEAVRNNLFTDIDKLTISIGYTKLMKDESVDSFYARCDQALYLAKDSGRDCIKSS